MKGLSLDILMTEIISAGNLVLKCPSQYFPCWNDFGQLGKCLKVVNEINETRLKMCVAVLAVEECFDFDVSDTKRVS